ncbi:uncharacterized protein [Cherax quadricarinatus]|uniref:uncharacterized protein n=1 Tax=Cherax quadricarinatus TaxID=27406 RepID=UPI00387E4AB1
MEALILWIKNPSAVSRYPASLEEIPALPCVTLIFGEPTSCRLAGLIKPCLVHLLSESAYFCYLRTSSTGHLVVPLCQYLSPAWTVHFPQHGLVLFLIHNDESVGDSP